MISFEKILKSLITPLLFYKEELEINQEEIDDSIYISCKVSKDDLGKVIGKQGSTVSILVELLNVLQGRSNTTVYLEFFS